VRLCAGFDGDVRVLEISLVQDVSGIHTQESDREEEGDLDLRDDCSDGDWHRRRRGERGANGADGCARTGSAESDQGGEAAQAHEGWRDSVGDDDAAAWGEHESAAAAEEGGKAAI
jgi:hypothetical protein